MAKVTTMMVALLNLTMRMMMMLVKGNMRRNKRIGWKWRREGGS